MNPFKTRPDETVCYALALIFGALTGYADLLSDTFLFPFALLLVFGGLLGFAQPRRASDSAFILGLCVPVARLLAVIVDYPLPYQITDFHTTFTALIPAFAGAYCGALVARLTERREEEED